LWLYGLYDFDDEIEDFCLQCQKVVSPTACHYLHIETAFLAWFDDKGG